MTEVGTGVLLLLFLFAAVFTDIRERRIPNALTGAGLATGLLLAMLLPQGVGLKASLLGALTGLACFLPMYAFRAMGAGDVKLMAMSGAFLGPLDTFESVLWVLLAGGVLALLFALRRGVLRKVLGNVRTLFYSAAASVQLHNMPDFSDAPSSAKLPYAVAIASGMAVFMAMREMGVSLL